MNLKKLSLFGLAAFAGACAPPSSPPLSEAVSSSGGRPYGTLASGNDHSCALGRDGKVYCWGSNDEGELGDGTTVLYRTTPAAVSSLTNQVFVSASNATSCSAGADGSAWCWGMNNQGQLGNGTVNGPFGLDGVADGYNTPQRVMYDGIFGVLPLTAVVEIAVGALHTCALDSSGQVWCWGYNSDGQLGDGTTTNRIYATTITTGAIGLAAGTFHTCALFADHTVSCWGDNGSGQLGNGTLTASWTPTVVGLSNVTAITAMDSGTCALLADGTARCWGSNMVGEMGNGTISTAQLTPTPVSLTGIASLAHGSGNLGMCAVLAGGTAACWGYNTDGETGSGTFTPHKATPVALGATGGSPPTEIALGLQHGCARTADGNLWCWGFNKAGQLGNGTTTTSSVPVYNDIPQWVSPQQRLAAASNGSSACAIASAFGDVACWGINHDGDLGNGTTTSSSTPVYVNGLMNVVALSGGGGFFGSGQSTYTALRGDGTVWAWGYNYSGECGEGAVGGGNNQPNAQTTPVQIPGIAGAVGVGPECAVLSNGTVWCWGQNDAGQTGIGNNTNSAQPTPVQVVGLTNVIAVAGGMNRCALRADGTVWCWGDNEYGAMGNGTSDSIQLTPVQVSGLTKVIAISVAQEFACALRDDSTVWCWGANQGGQLGDGTTTARKSPVEVPSFFNAVAIATGNNDSSNGGTTCAVIYDGTMRCWGNNIHGQVGNGTTSTHQLTPVVVSSLSKVVQISLGGSSTYALRADGTLWSWGYNSDGELGLGTTGGTHTTPAQISFSP